MPNEKSMAVLLDAAREAFGDDAGDVLLWLQHPDAVRTLLDRPVRVARIDEYREFDGYVCFECGELEGHDSSCAAMAALEQLDHQRGHVDVAEAFDLQRERDAHRERSDIENGRATRDLAEGQLVTVRMDDETMRMWQRPIINVQPVVMGHAALHECAHAMLETVRMGDGATIIQRCINCGTIITPPAG